ncbi:outer membrane beta-barrel protein [Desulfobacter latus]|uniref:Outer membrane beta-barrel protein n=1 Tax=Desulfobacter latus TaxID=2292 RepID=A0A850T9W5_9BACT|nr:outer membrane beta-barrel protein [Desulfobacter latus]NWH06372.1 outer membrane beta-barrel protein [Desulfobacter latus]
MKSSIILSASLIILAVAASVRAEPYSITPWIKTKQSYSDNILFSEKNEASDFITTFTGGLTLEQNLERLKTNLSGHLNQFFYWDYNDLDSLDYNVSGSLKYRMTERAGLNASARYTKDSQKDRDTETTGLVVSGDRKKADLSLGADYMLSELNRIEISMYISDSDRNEADESEDSNTTEVGLTFRRDMSAYFKNTVGLCNLKYLHYTGEEDTYTESGLNEYTFLQNYTSDVYQFSTGFSHDISELYSLFFQVGASYTQTDEKQDIYWLSFNNISFLSPVLFSQSEYDTDTWGGIFSTGIDYKDEYWTMGLTLFQDVRGGTGTSGAIQRTSLSGTLSRKLSDALTLTFNASAYLNKSERESNSDTDTLTFNLQPGFRYKLKRNFILSFAWRFTSVEDREDDTTTTRNLVYFDLKKEFDLKDF